MEFLEDDNGGASTLVAAFTELTTCTVGALNTFTAPAGTTVSVAANATYWVTVNHGVTNRATGGSNHRQRPDGGYRLDDRQ